MIRALTDSLKRRMLLGSSQSTFHPMTNTATDSAARTVTPDEAARLASQTMDAQDAAASFLGIEVEQCLPGFARLSFTVTPQMVNGHDMCHGGLIFSLADTAMAHASNSHNVPAVAVSCAIEFLSPGRTGDKLTATAQEQSLKGRTGIHDVRVCNQDDELIALFRGTTRKLKGAIVDDLIIQGR
jgi:acyl-CoA thioesterase